jgi:hypothetical protein
MKAFVLRLVNTENALRVAATLLFLPMFFITDGSILCTTDTGAYLQTISNMETQGLAAAIPMDRSVFYGLFLWAGKHYFGLSPLLASLGIQLETPHVFSILLIPCLLLLMGMTYWLERLFSKHVVWIILISMSVSTILTPLPWFVFQVMPDVFTPLLFLYAMVFLSAKSNSTRIFASIVLVFSALMHHSHLPLLTAFAAGIHLIKPMRKHLNFSSQQTKPLFVISFLPWIITITLNALAGNGFTPSKGSHVFLMGKLCENGILKAYLDENPIEQNPLAKRHPEIATFYQYKNKLPKHAWDFVWNEQPLLGPTGGWHHGKELYTDIYLATLSSPTLLSMHLESAVKATLQQVFLNHAGDGLEPLQKGGAVDIELKKHFPEDHLGFFGQSAQQQSRINFGTFNQVYDIVAAFLIITCLLLLYKHPNPNYAWLLGVAVFFVLCNAFVTANLANVLSRLNARDFWLIPFVCASIIATTLFNLSDKKNQSTL